MPKQVNSQLPDEKKKVFVKMMVVFVAVVLKVAMIVAMVVKRNSYFSYSPFSAQFQ